MRKGLIVILVTLFCATAFAQGISSMQQKLADIQKKIEAAEKNLTVLKGLESKNNQFLNQLQSSANTVTKQYNNLQYETNKISKQLAVSTSKLTSSKALTDSLQNDISSKLILYQKLSFYVMHSNLNYDYFELQAFLKTLIINEQQLLEQIIGVNDSLINKTAKEQTLKQQKSRVLAQVRQQKNQLTYQISAKNQQLDKLKKEKLAFSSSVSSLQKQQLALEAQIQEIIKQNESNQQHKENNWSSTLSEAISKIGKAIKPLDGSVVTAFDSDKSLKYGASTKSRGIEIESYLGAMVKSAWSGRVIYTGKLSSLGDVVIVDNGYGIATVYGNLIRAYVKKGSVVEQGEKIGVLGYSQDMKNVLYFEVRYKATPMNPQSFY